MNKILKYSIKIVVGLSILAILLYKLDLNQLLSTISQFNFTFLPLLVFIFIFSILIGGLNIKIFISALKEDVKFVRVVRHYITSWAYGLLIPGKIGEFSIIYFLKKEGVSIGEGTLIAILDKIITFVCFFVVALFGIFSFFSFKDAMIILGIISVSFIIFIMFLITKTGRTMPAVMIIL